MTKTQILAKGWRLLNSRERRNAGIILVVAIVSALSSALMVSAVFPFLSVLSNPSLVQENRLLKWTYETGQFDSVYNFLFALGIGAFFVIIFSNTIQIARIYAVTKFTSMRLHTISYRLLASYLFRPYEYFLDHNTGEMSTRVLSESQQVVQQFFRPFAEAVSAAFTIIALVSVLLWVKPVIAISAFAVVGGLYGFTYQASRRFISKLGERRAQANEMRYRLSSEALGGIKDIKLLGREQDYINRYIGPSRRMAHAHVNTHVVSQVPKYIMQSVAFGGIILLCIFLMDADNVNTGDALSDILPTLGVFAFAGQRLIPELQKLYQNITMMRFSAPAVELVYRDAKPEAVKVGVHFEDVGPPLGLNRKLQLHRINYTYPKADRPGLLDVTFCVNAGERIGVVGTTGAGKTTLADVILGLLPPTSGRIIVDGQEVNIDNVRSWQKTVGYVPQQIYLIDASIAENIAFGLPKSEIDMDMVRRAAKIAQVHDFIVGSLPNGYETPVGERGVRLSGGQRQRLGIARAMYYEKDLIVFDEATSALDNSTERDVISSIESLPGEKTVIVIAHRITTVKNCDRIVVLDSGQIVGFDSWRNLLEKNKHFREITQQ